MNFPRSQQLGSSRGLTSPKFQMEQVEPRLNPGFFLGMLELGAAMALLSFCVKGNFVKTQFILEALGLP